MSQSKSNTATHGAGVDRGLAAEIEARKTLGATQLSLERWEQHIREFGYRFDRSMDCRSNALYMTGERAGQSYPCLSLRPAEIDTGVGWCNEAARRDHRWEQLKASRDSYFAVVRGHLAEF